MYVLSMDMHMYLHVEAIDLTWRIIAHINTEMIYLYTNWNSWMNTLKHFSISAFE